MKDTLTNSNAGDFRQRYQGTYGWFNHNVEKPLLVQLTDVNASRCIFVDKRGVDYRVNSDTGIPFEFFPLDRRVANYKDTVLYSTRKPERQWHRGACDANTAIVDLNTGKAVPVDFDTIEALYSPPVNFAEFAEEFKAGKRKAAAISDKFVLRGKFVYIFDRPIGLVNGMKVTVNKLFLQELKDVNHRNKLGLTVEVMND